MTKQTHIRPQYAHPAEIDFSDIAGHLGHQSTAPECMIEGSPDPKKSKAGDLSSLDHSTIRNNTVGSSAPLMGRYQLITHNCRSRLCPACGPRLVGDLRRDLAPVLATFTNILMFTLTIDPQLFGSPREAYQYLRENRCISEIMRLIRDSRHPGIRIHSTRYVYVLEFQENGYPHYHVLLDASWIPVDELLRIWSTFRPRPAGPVADGHPPFGWVFVKKHPYETTASPQAIRDALNYVTEAQPESIPNWVLDMGTDDSRVAMHGTSRNFFPKIPGQDEPRPRPNRPRTSKTRSPSRPHRDRIEACGQSTEVVRVLERTDPVSGEIVTRSSHWQVRLDVTEAELQLLRENDFFDNHMSEVMAQNPDAVVDRISRFLGRPVHRVPEHQPPTTEFDSRSARPASRIKATEFFGQTEGTSNE